MKIRLKGRAQIGGVIHERDDIVEVAQGTPLPMRTVRKSCDTVDVRNDVDSIHNSGELVDEPLYEPIDEEYNSDQGA